MDYEQLGHEWPDGPIRSALVNLCAYVAERNR